MDEHEFEAAKIAAELVKGSWSDLTGAAKRRFNEIEAVINSVFRKYLEREFKKNSKIKTLIHRYKPISIFSSYESAELKLRTQSSAPLEDEPIVGEDEFRTSISKGDRLIISATAGAGKSMMMKHVFCKMVTQKSNFIPVLFELRNLNLSDWNSLADVIRDHIASSNDKFNSTHFSFSMKNGKLCLLLDGFDEIRRDIREKVETEIIRINNLYPDVPVLISTRPDERFVSWSEYSEFRVQALSIKKVCSLVERIDFDKDIKQLFIQRIQSDLYASHDSFLSNPLLASMMLMTFTQFSDIPLKEHLFYEQAFLALIDQHDSTKIGFKREFYSELPRDEFTNLFSTFCAFTYLDEKYTMSVSEIERYSKTAIAYAGLECAAAKFIEDLLKTICVIIQDGDELSFIHRSFQEYFTAKFIINSTPEVGAKLLQTLLERSSSPDSVLLLVGEINLDYFERHFLQKEISATDSQIKTAQKKAPFHLARLFFSGITKLNDPEPENPDNEVIVLVNSVGTKSKHFTLLQIIRSIYYAEQPVWFSHTNDSGQTTHVHAMSVFGFKSDPIVSKDVNYEPISTYFEIIAEQFNDVNEQIQKRLAAKKSILAEIVT